VRTIEGTKKGARRKSRTPLEMGIKKGAVWGTRLPLGRHEKRQSIPTSDTLPVTKVRLSYIKWSVSLPLSNHPALGLEVRLILHQNQLFSVLVNPAGQSIDSPQHAGTINRQRTSPVPASPLASHCRGIPCPPKLALSLPYSVFNTIPQAAPR
jgi:hypothetical protein